MASFRPEYRRLLRCLQPPASRLALLRATGLRTAIPHRSSALQAWVPGIAAMRGAAGCAQWPDAHTPADRFVCGFPANACRAPHQPPVQASVDWPAALQYGGARPLARTRRRRARGRANAAAACGYHFHSAAPSAIRSDHRSAPQRAAHRHPPQRSNRPRDRPGGSWAAPVRPAVDESRPAARTLTSIRRASRPAHQ